MERWQSCAYYQGIKACRRNLAVANLVALMRAVEFHYFSLLCFTASILCIGLLRDFVLVIVI